MIKPCFKKCFVFFAVGVSVDNKKPWKLCVVRVQPFQDYISLEELKYRSEVNIQIMTVVRNKSQLNKPITPPSEWMVPIQENSILRDIFKELKRLSEDHDPEKLPKILMDLKSGFNPFKSGFRVLKD